MTATALLLMAAATQGDVPAPHPLDSFMQDVSEACLLPSLEKNDPRLYFSDHGWTRKGRSDTLEKRIGSAVYSVAVAWPASEKSSASCSFESNDVPAAEVYDWFRRRIGEPQDFAWSDRQIGGWRMQTNGHDAGVYVSRKGASGDTYVGMMLHILQK